MLLFIYFIISFNLEIYVSVYILFSIVLLLILLLKPGSKKYVGLKGDMLYGFILIASVTLVLTAQDLLHG
jgi:hypothetical protein